MWVKLRAPHKHQTKSKVSLEGEMKPHYHQHHIKHGYFHLRLRYEKKNRYGSFQTCVQRKKIIKILAKSIWVKSVLQEIIFWVKPLSDIDVIASIRCTMGFRYKNHHCRTWSTYQIFHQIWKLFGDNWELLEGSTNVIGSKIPNIFTRECSFSQTI